MNKAEYTHVMSMARHIREHAASLAGMMAGLETLTEEQAVDLPTRMAVQNLERAKWKSEEIMQVLTDMMPRLRELEHEEPLKTLEQP